MYKPLAIVAIACTPFMAMAQKAVSDQDIPTKDILQADDVIIQGSLNVGFDAVLNRNFGSDTQILSENNLRILFEDTSASASFPGNDWRLTANDDTNGGEDYFSIDDATGNQTKVFKVEAGASSNTLVVADNNAIGIRTDAPLVNSVHLKYGDTPTLRLQQDASSGFTQQTWDLAGNETSFFIRDVNNSSSLPFKIESGCNENLFVLDDSDRIGLNTVNPQAFLHARKQTENNAAETVAKFNVVDSGNDALYIDNASSTNSEFRSRLRGLNENGETGLTLLSMIDDTLGATEPAHIIDATTLSGAVLANHPVLQVQNNAAPLLTVDYTGFVGVGVTAPSEKIHTDGKIRMESGASNGHLISGDANGVMSWTDPSTINLTAFNNDLIDNNDFISNVNLNAGNNLVFIGTGGAFNASVDLSGLINDADSDPTNEIETWTTLAGIPAGFADNTDDVNDADSDPTNEIETWSTLAGIPAGFADDTDDVNDADADATNEFNTALSLTGTTLNITDGGSTLSQDLSSLQDGNGLWTENGPDIGFDSGNVGIGTTSPSEALHVVGNIAKTGMLIGASDARIKDNIKSITGATDIINRLDGKQFVFNSGELSGLNLPEGLQYGLIAQEVEAELEHLVKTGIINATDENGNEVALKGVAYEQLIPVLINALKEQSSEIEQLKAQQSQTSERLAYA